MKVEGWVFVHAGGFVETDYFNVRRFTDKGRRISAVRWREKYRPNCRMVKATLTVPMRKRGEP